MKLSRKGNSRKEIVKYITMTSSKRKYEISFKDNELRVNRKALEIDVISNENGFTYVQYKNRKYPVEILSKSQNKYEVMINGVTYNFSIETPFSYKRKKHLDKIKNVSRKEVIVAPMPGKIVDILVEENTEVKEGDSIVILEAMKMQNEIICHTAGKVSSINIKAEDTVMKDDVLLEIEK